MTDQQLQDLEKICSAASGGVWSVGARGGLRGLSGGVVRGGPIQQFRNGEGQTQVVLATGQAWMRPDEQEANALFVATSRAALPEALAEIRRLRAELELRPMTEKLKELLAGCKCGVFITVNEHRDYYQKAADFLEERATDQHERQECAAPEVITEMIARDTIVVIQFYPNTPIGSYRITHYDLDTALDHALQALKDQS